MENSDFPVSLVEFSKSPILTVRDLAITLNGNRVLENVSFDLSDHEILALIGTSGCGKSILLKSIVGLVTEEFPNAKLEGNIEYKGSSILGCTGEALNDLRRRIVYLPQNPSVFYMSVYANIAHMIRYWRRRSPALFEYFDRGRKEEDLVEYYLAQANLWSETKDKLKLNAKSLSTGQQQRLCLARALTLEPEVLLLDEPAAHLDHIAMAKLEESIDELRESRSMIIVTHSMHQAARTSQRTARMRPAGIIELGATDQIFTNPRHKFTEDYITGTFG